MPNWKTHLMGGFLLYVTIWFIVVMHFKQAQYGPIFLVGLIPYHLAVLMPDIDIPSSKIRKFMERILLAAALILLGGYFFMKKDEFLFAAIGVIAVILFLWFVKHRGIFHNPLMGLLLAAPIIILNAGVGMLVFVGYSSHLLLDGLIKGES